MVPVQGGRPGALLEAKEVQGGVTPSVHLGVPKSLSVTPGRGEGVRQQLGWRKVCGTDWSGILVLKGGTRSSTLPSNLDHLSVDWMRRSKYSTA